jgi:LacI family transcriptional regulator
MSPRPTAIFAANDLMAIGAMQALREEGLVVPDDISLVGFDNIAMAALVHPGLTTIDQFPREVGTLAAKRLVSRLEGEDDGPQTFQQLQYQLVIRESTRALDAPAGRREAVTR